MARILIVGCGCRGRALTAELRSRGHAVRGTTRDPGNLDAIAACGAEPVLADPDRVGTIVPALDRVAVLCVLLGSATGPVEQLRSLHGDRLEMLVHRSIDTTVRAIVYEAAGSVGQPILAAGAALVVTGCDFSRIPYRLLEHEAAPPFEPWVTETAQTVEHLLGREPA
jgi:nucleoside-diphosphate-sugar epimerase